MTIILSVLNRFKKFFTVRLLGKFAVKWLTKIPPHLPYIATLPCETLRSAKQAINDKLQGLRCGGVVNNQIKKGLLLSLCTCALGQHTAKRRKKRERDNHL